MIEKIVGDKPKIAKEDIRKGDLILTCEVKRQRVFGFGVADGKDEEGDWWTLYRDYLTNVYYEDGVGELEHYLIDRPRPKLALPKGTVIRVKELLVMEGDLEHFSEVDFIGFVCEGREGLLVRLDSETDEERVSLASSEVSVSGWEVLWTPSTLDRN